MKKSQDERVQKFLDEIAMLSDEKSKILYELRKIVFTVLPNTTERMMYGGIMFSTANDFGGVFVSKNHVSFEFGNGSQMKDPKKRLEGTGKFRRHLKIQSFSDITEKEVEFFVQQAVTLSTS